MDVTRRFAAALAVGAGVSLAGCQSPMMGGFTFWKGSNSPSLGAAPDVNKQKFDGLSQQFSSNQSRAAGQALPGMAPLGSARPAESSNFLTASWKKTTAAVNGSLGNKSKAEEAADDPLRLDRVPKKVGPEVYVAAARLLENQGKFPDAEAQYQKALAAAPGDVRALVGLARLYDRQAHPKEAVDLYQRALQSEPSSSLVYNDLGLCYARQQQFEPSLQSLRKAVELQPTSVKYRNNLATVLVESGRVDEAFRELSANNPAAVAHYNLAYLLQQKGHLAEAQRHYEQALAIDPSMTHAREMLGQLTGQSGPKQSDPPPPARTAAVPAIQTSFSHASTTPASPSTPAPPPLAVQAAPQPAMESTPSYTAGTSSDSVHTVVPQTPDFTPAAPPSFHIGDDNPAAQTAARDSNSPQVQ